MQGNRGKGRNRLIAPRSHSSAFALFPPPRLCLFDLPGLPSPPARRIPAAPRRWTRKTEVWDEKVDHGRSACTIFFFFPFRDSEGAFSHVEATCALLCMRPAWLFLVYAALVRSNDGHEKKELRCRTRNG